MTATRPDSIDIPGYSETMPCVRESARTARRLARAALEAWNFDQTLIENGELVVSELVANSVRHSGCRHIRVVVARTGDKRVRIAVSDTSLHWPILREPGHDEPRGRGLRLVAALAADWGTEPRGWGKVVWADLAPE